MDISTEEILTLVKKKMKEQGASDHETYKSFSKETIEYFQEKGKLTNDDNHKFILEQLMEVWEYVKSELSDNY